MQVNSPSQQDHSDSLPADLSSPGDLFQHCHEGFSLMVVYQEYCQLLEAGQFEEAGRFRDQYPGFAKELSRLLEVHGFAKKCAQQNGKNPFPAVGELFAGFHLLEELGKGSLSTVFRAVVPALGNRQVAVKISPFGDVEAKIQGLLEHPNIVPANWAAEERDSTLVAIMMPYLGRATLEHLRRQILAGPELPATADFIAAAIQDPLLPPDSLPPLLQQGTYFDAVCFLAEQMARGLAYLHSQGIQHRDLKPSNVLVTPAGKALLMDFNLSVDADFTNCFFGGTPLYMSPEHLRAMFSPGQPGRFELEPRTDLFSFGVIVYELLAGQHPFCPPEKRQVDTHLGDLTPLDELHKFLLKQQGRGVRTLRDFHPEAEEPVLNLIERCLAFRPEDRPASAAEVADTLAAYLKSRQDQGTEVVGSGSSRPLVRRRWIAAAVLAVCCFGATGFALTHLAVTPAMNAAVDHEAAGVEAYHAGDYQKAVEHFSEVLWANPNDANALFGRARSFQQWGEQNPAKFADARSDYERCHKISQWPSILACLGYCYHRDKQFELAQLYYLKAIKAEFATAEVYNNLGNAQIRKHQFDEALKNLALAYQKTEPHDKIRAVVLHNRAQACWNFILQIQVKKIPEELLQIDDLIFQGQHAIREAIQNGEESAQLFREAALLFALTNPPDEGSVDMVNKCLRKAIELGQEPESLVKVSHFDHLRNYINFDSLLSISPRNPIKTNANLILDPLQGKLTS